MVVIVIFLTVLIPMISSISQYQAIPMFIQDFRKSNLVECLVDIIENLQGPVRKVSFVTSSDDNVFLHNVAGRVRVPIVVNTVEKMKATGIDKRMQNDVVIMHGNINASTVLKTVLWNGGTRFIVTYETHECEIRMGQDFRTFWNERVIKVFGLVEESEGVSLYSFLPYQERDCDNTKPIRLDIWNNGTFSGDGFSFLNDEVRIKTGNGCPMNATTAKAEPSVLLPKDKRCVTGEEIEGMEARYVLEFARRLNFSLTICLPKDGQSWGSLYPSTGVLGEIRRRNTDFGCGGFVQIPERYGKIEFSYPYTVKDCITFVVPTAAGRDRLYWLKNISGNLHLIHWALISTSFIAVSAILFLFGSHTLMSSFLYNLSSFLGRSIVFPKLTSLKILIFFWIIFSSVVGNIYQASMGREIILPLESSELETFHQLLDSDLRLHGHPNILKVLNKDDPVHMTIANRLIVSNMDVVEETERILAHRDSSFIVSFNLFTYMLLLNPRFRGNVGVLKECAKNYFPVMVLQKNSPFSAKFFYLIIRISESGIARYWRSIFYRDNAAAYSKFTPVTLRRSLGIFTILVTGLLAGVTVFLVELVFNYTKKIIVSRTFTKVRGKNTDEQNFNAFTLLKS